MPRPRTREDGGEAQWGKVEARRGVPREQVGESLLDRGREESRSRQGFNAQSQVSKLPANLTEVIEGRREGGGKDGALCRRSRCVREGRGSEVQDESLGEWERERNERFSKVGVCTYTRKGLWDNENFSKTGKAAMVFTLGIWLWLKSK